MAKKKRGKKHEEEASEAWLLPYSDLMTLLLALFIALFAISQTDQTKLTQLAQAFTAAFNMGGPSFFDKAGPSVSPQRQIMTDEDQGNNAYLQENQNLQDLKEQLDEYIQQNSLDGELSTQLEEEGLMIRIKERALFPSGSAELVPESQRIGPIVAGLLAAVPERVLISGHTDTDPRSISFKLGIEFGSSHDFHEIFVVDKFKFKSRKIFCNRLRRIQTDSNE